MNRTILSQRRLLHWMADPRVRRREIVNDSTSWQLALMRSRLSTLERKADQPHADSSRLLADCVRELKSTFDFLEAAGERLRGVDAELKKAMGAVLHGRDRFKALVDLLPDAFVATDLAAVIVDANAAAGRLLNLSQRALSGRPLHMFLNGERVEFLRFIKELPDAAVAPERELRLRPRERHFVRVLARVGIVREADGRPVALHWILRPAAIDEPAVPLGGMASSWSAVPDGPD
jgi:PAS domain S-box-containing protein